MTKSNLLIGISVLSAVACTQLAPNNESSKRSTSFSVGDSSRLALSYFESPEARIDGTREYEASIPRLATLPSNPSQLCKDFPYGSPNGPGMGEVINDLSDFGLFARTIYAESDWRYTGKDDYINEKAAVGATVLNRLALVNSLLFMTDSQGYRVVPSFLNFVSKTTNFGRAKIKDIVLYKPSRNFNVFKEGGGGAYTDYIQNQVLTPTLNTAIGAEPLCTGTWSPNGEAASFNCACLNLISSVQVAATLAYDFNGGYLDDPFAQKGATLAFNSNNTNPGGFLKWLGKGTLTTFFGLLKPQVTNIRPPERPNDVPYVFGPVKPSTKLLDSGSGMPTFGVGQFVSIYGTGLKKGDPVQTQADAETQKYPVSIEDLQVLIDDIRAEILYASENQINMRVPEGVDANSVTVTIVNELGQSIFEQHNEETASGQ